MRRRRRVRKGPSHRTPHPENQPHPSPPHHHRKLTPPRWSPPPSLSRRLRGYREVAWQRHGGRAQTTKERSIDLSRRMAGVSPTYLPVCTLGSGVGWNCNELCNGNHTYDSSID
ncbi:hypothetical protein EAG_12771 [Camponotus floridanus]|uniref:Uncharacterized protein n=1 Tax=Camponotus floridanus TaxID=104421 RepID=E2AZH3_CAMFO|nr:hypothetical protein EAG_12771 [Camponotus floridanus]